MNLLILLIWTIISLVFVLGAWKFFGKSGLFAVISACVALVNIFTVKSLTVLGLGTVGGSVLYSSIYFATDIISEHFEGKAARRAVMLGFCMSVFTVLSGLILIKLTPAPWDWADKHLSAILSVVPRVTVASMIAYLISQNLDTWAYDYLRRKFPEYLWIRNNGSTMLSQLIDSVVFFGVAFFGTMPVIALIQTIFTTFLIKVFIAAIDTPFIYISTKISPIDKN